MSTLVRGLPFALRIAPPVVLGGRLAAKVVERNILSYRRMWIAFVTGFMEPIFYLFSLGVGLGPLVGALEGPDGRMLEYAAFVAPGLLAASAMNGAIIDATFGLFFKLKYAKTYEAVMVTPVSIREIAWGEISWALMRGTVYSTVFIVVMALKGVISSPWAILALPACTLIALAFASLGMAGASYLRGWQDFDFLQLVLLPLFLFSATFYPLSTYPAALQWVVQLTPLYHGVDLLRRLCIGAIGWEILVHVAYLGAMAAFGSRMVKKRLTSLLYV